MDAEMLKGHLDAMVLAALRRAGPLHGYAVIQELKRQSGETFDLPEGTLYPVLHRLENAGLLTSEWVTPPGGRKRRVYALTETGEQSLVRKLADWRSFTTAVDAVLKGAG
jgi:DNA-binding PadR family transcriptional regulator